MKMRAQYLESWRKVASFVYDFIFPSNSKLHFLFLLIPLLFFKDFIYLFMRDTEREAET